VALVRWSATPVAGGQGHYPYARQRSGPRRASARRGAAGTVAVGAQPRRLDAGRLQRRPRVLVRALRARASGLGTRRVTQRPAGDVGRISALDGLRGWAALSVIVYHLTWELFGALYPIYRNPWLSIFGNGAFAVAVFFAISGYVLTIGRWNRDDNPPLVLTLI